MRVLVSTLLLVGLVLVGQQDARAGAGLCIAKGKTIAGTATDVRYFLRWGNGVNGYAAERAAREDHAARYGQSLPSCRSTGRLDTGHFMVIRREKRGTRGDLITTFALGYGASPDVARAEAVAELMRRDWSYRRGEPFSIVDTGAFADSDVSGSGSSGGGSGGRGAPDSGAVSQLPVFYPGMGNDARAPDLGDPNLGNPNLGNPNLGNPRIPSTSVPSGGALSDADTQRLQQIADRVLQRSQRIAQYGFDQYGGAQFCADIQALKCDYAELVQLGWNDPAVQASLGQVMPLYDQLLDSDCGGARACSGQAAEPTSRRVEFNDPYQNLELDLPGAMIATPPPPKSRPSLSNDGKLAPGTLSDCVYDPSVKYARNPCAPARSPQNR